MPAKPYGTDPSLPNYARAEYIAALPDLKLIADQLGGTRAMHAASRQYVRKWKAENDANYEIRRTCEEFFSGYGRTLSAAVGMLFAKSPQMTWNRSEAALSPIWDNIDASGNKGEVFLKRFSDAALRDGLAIILTDHPSPPIDPATGGPALVTAETEAALNLRPKWARYGRAQAINWDDDVVDNQHTLTLLVLHEVGRAADGRYGTKEVNRYRELRLVDTPDGRAAAWILWEQVDDDGNKADSFRVHSAGTFRNKDGRAAPFLPVSIAYTGRSEAVMDSAIPLLPVAEANLGHWRLSTDLRFNTLVSAFAQPTWIGEMEKDPITGLADYSVGPLVGVHMKEGGEFRWTEPNGSGLERIALLAAEKLRQMAALGVSFLATDTRAAETAEAKRLDASAENATLATAATGIEDAANMALEHLAWFMGIDKPAAPVLAISRDFEATTMASDVMRAYVEALKAGLPDRVFIEAWQQGGRIAPDEDAEALAMEMMVGAIAGRDAEAAGGAEPPTAAAA
jgi:hypothetical protein